MADYKTFRNTGLVCLLVAVLVALMSISAESPLIPLIISAVFVLATVAFIAISFNLKRRVRAEEAERIEKNKALFTDADSAAAEKLEALFLEEFKFDVNDSVVTADTDESYTDSSVTAWNDSMSFARAAADLKQSAEEAGVAISEPHAASIIASFVSSRLLVAKKEATDQTDAWVRSIADYFGASLFTEVITEAHDPAQRLLRIPAEDGALTATAVLSALISAAEKPQVMHIIHLKNMPAEKVSEYLIPYIKYLGAPHSKAEVSAKGSDEVVIIPDNVWFITELDAEAPVEAIPSYIWEYAALIPVKQTECLSAEVKTEFVPITLTDFDFLSEKCRSKYILNEDVWKKIDEIEAFTFKHAAYKIGNKLWLRIETYVSALLSMQTESAPAVDNALASIILPPLASILDGKISENEQTLIDEIERIFGEDNVQLSREMLVSKA